MMTERITFDAKAKKLRRFRVGRGEAVVGWARQAPLCTIRHAGQLAGILLTISESGVVSDPKLSLELPTTISSVPFFGNVTTCSH